MAHSNASIIEIFCGTLWEAEMIKTLLKEAAIESFLKNTILNSYAYEPIQSEGVQVMIRSTDAAEAHLIIKAYFKNR